MGKEELLQNYRLLIAKVDGWLTNLDKVLGSQMECRPGCSECCKNFTVYPVEAYSIVNHINKNMMFQHEYIEIENIQKDEEGFSCPFLDDDGLCLIYRARPLICRTHGYPIAVHTDDYCNDKGGIKIERIVGTEGHSIDVKQIRVDHCPKNFQDTAMKREHLKREYLLDLDHLNTVLFSINSIFVNECGRYSGKQLSDARLSFDEIIKLFSVVRLGSCMC